MLRNVKVQQAISGWDMLTKVDIQLVISGEEMLTNANIQPVFFRRNRRKIQGAHLKCRPFLSRFSPKPGKNKCAPAQENVSLESIGYVIHHSSRIV